ncbi:PLP-dependent aminotransferase family protein [Leekyejoonella antrihumi]|uniref:PLP-dependent aminotransferase family protein n=1 Tax=Leekyejoonella antrihumi TaxID=1660198 RepID=A0A563E063_9MICO|nr:PLP-dependent aminotransferase family protein [Leekyejoonella antrihumi]TWP35930.1 PLP-dependent aminotransferase family protein [Leekyejoonella antrihumi]
MSNDSSVGRVVRELRSLAETGSPGDQLPSTRSLVTRLQVSPVTVSQATASLVAAGVLTSVPGRGVFIAPRSTRHTHDFAWQSVTLGSQMLDVQPIRALQTDADPSVRNLNSGYISADLQPRRELMAAATRALRRPSGWSTAPPEGIHELRQLFAADLGTDTADVLITPGTQAALNSAFRSLASPGQTVLLEEPTYPGAIVAARAAGLQITPVPTDRDGLRPALLRSALAATGARVVLTQPAFANPTGHTLAATRRAEVLDAVAAAGAFLIEDDWARDLALDAPAPPPLFRDDRDGHVIYLRSLTKSASPSMRVGAVAARGPVRERLVDSRLAEDLFVPRPLQEIAIELLSSPAWPRHLRRLHAQLRGRRDALVSALHQQVPQITVDSVPQGGSHLWARVATSLSETELVAAAHAAGMVIGPGTQFHTGEVAGLQLRLSFGAAPQDELRAGAGLLARLLADG